MLPISRMWMSLDFGEEAVVPWENRYTGAGRTCKLHSERLQVGISLVTLLCSHSSNHCMKRKKNPDLAQLRERYEIYWTITWAKGEHPNWRICSGGLAIGLSTHFGVTTWKWVLECEWLVNYQRKNFSAFHISSHPSAYTCIPFSALHPTEKFPPSQITQVSWGGKEGYQLWL